MTASAQAIAVIPARYDSSRFPGKMLANATGKPLVQHVYEQAKLARSLARVIVATDDDRIHKAVQSFGGESVMTRHDHANGSSRIAEAVENIAGDFDIVVNVQGDEPEISPELIDLGVRTLKQSPDCPVATIAARFENLDDVNNPNIVKVVLDQRSCALYFSRAMIPFCRDGESVTPAIHLKHVGLYVYRRAFLNVYQTLNATPLEQAEKLEQLRILEHGYDIAVAIAPPHLAQHHGIDTPEQYERFVRRLNRGL